VRTLSTEGRYASAAQCWFTSPVLRVGSSDSNWKRQRNVPGSNQTHAAGSRRAKECSHGSRGISVNLKSSSVDVSAQARPHATDALPLPQDLAEVLGNSSAAPICRRETQFRAIGSGAVPSSSPGQLILRPRSCVRRAGDKQFAGQPCVCAERSFLASDQSENGFHALEYQFDLPAQAVQFQDLSLRK